MAADIKTFGLIGVTFTMGLAIKTSAYWAETEAASGKRALVASESRQRVACSANVPEAFGWPNKISALLWIDTASMGYLPDIPVPMGAFYGAESIAIITTGASATSEQALAALWPPSRALAARNANPRRARSMA